MTYRRGGFETRLYNPSVSLNSAWPESDFWTRETRFVASCVDSDVTLSIGVRSVFVWPASSRFQILDYRGRLRFESDAWC